MSQEPMQDPIPMRLLCPSCHQYHIDEGEFVTKIHTTHECGHCGMRWAPASVPTIGVKFLPPKIESKVLIDTAMAVKSTDADEDGRLLTNKELAEHAIRLENIARDLLSKRTLLTYAENLQMGECLVMMGAMRRRLLTTGAES